MQFMCQKAGREGFVEIEELIVLRTARGAQRLRPAAEWLRSLCGTESKRPAPERDRPWERSALMRQNSRRRPMVMSLGLSCGAVGRPKLALPTVPTTPPKLVRLNMLNASAR